MQATGYVSRRVAVDPEVQLRVLEWPGAGRPYLLVHGLASNALLWRGVAAELVAAGHRVVAVDLRGHGESDAPTTGHTTAGAAADLRALVEALDLGTPVLAGQSWGGNVVLSYAAAGHPAHAVACVDGGWLHLADNFADFDDCWAALAPPPLSGLTAASFTAMLERGHPSWSAAAVEATVANLRELPSGQLTRRLDLPYHESIVRSMYDEPPRRWYPHVDVPVLLLPAGDDSGPRAALPVEAQRELPSAELRWYPGGDHDLHAQYPVEVAADLLRLARA